MTIGSASVPMSDSVKNLGDTPDCHLTMKTHISNLVQLANFELCCISSIHHLLSTNATKILVSASVLSCFDYCNSLQPGCPQYLLNKLYKFETTLLNLSWKFLKLTISLLILFLSTGCPLIHKYNSEYKLTSLCNNCLSFNTPVSWPNSRQFTNHLPNYALLLILPFSDIGTDLK